MRKAIAACLAAAGLLLAGCSSAGPGGGAAAVQPATGPNQPAAGQPGAQARGTLRLGLADDVTDAPALLGWQMGMYGRDLGKVTIEPEPFTSGAAEAAALQDGQLDAAYLDPVTALRLWQAAPGGLIKIVAGAASGGAELVVSARITSPARLKGRRLAAPAGAQQAAADQWLRQRGLPALTSAETSATTGAGLLQEFRSGRIAGAWEPPPLDVQMADAGGRVLVNEASLWAGGQFPTSVLVVTRRFLSANPLAVAALLAGQAQADHYLANRAAAAAALTQRLSAVGSHLPEAVVAQSLAQLTFTEKPLPGPLLTEARHAAAAGLIKPAGNLAGIYDLGPLNQVLKAAGQPPARA